MEGGEGRGEEAFLVMWPRRLSALNPPLLPRHSYGVVSGNGFFLVIATTSNLQIINSTLI